jgi:hypothetical protein
MKKQVVKSEYKSAGNDIIHVWNCQDNGNAFILNTRTNEIIVRLGENLCSARDIESAIELISE